VSVTDCNFRDLPQAGNYEDEMRGEAWFYVGENDVFPESFIQFLGFNDAQRAALLRLHAEILTAAFWRGVQQRLVEVRSWRCCPTIAPRAGGGEPVSEAARLAQPTLRRARSVSVTVRTRAARGSEFTPGPRACDWRNPADQLLEEGADIGGAAVL